MNKQEKVLVQFVRVVTSHFELHEKKVVKFDSPKEAEDWIAQMRAIDRDSTYTNFAIRAA